MSNDENLNSDLPIEDPLADDLFDNLDEAVSGAEALPEEAAFDSAELDSAEFDNMEFSALGGGESESRESEEIQVEGDSASRESTEIPLSTDTETETDTTPQESYEEDEVAAPVPANEWVLISFFSSLGIYLAVAMTFIMDPDVIMQPIKNIDWAFATILIPISLITFMASSLALLSKPRGKEWLLLLPTFGPILPIAVAALSIMALFNLA